MGILPLCCCNAHLNLAAPSVSHHASFHLGTSLIGRPNPPSATFHSLYSTLEKAELNIERAQRSCLVPASQAFTAFTLALWTCFLLSTTFTSTSHSIDPRTSSPFLGSTLTRLIPYPHTVASTQHVAYGRGGSSQRGCSVHCITVCQYP